MYSASAYLYEVNIECTMDTESGNHLHLNQFPLNLNHFTVLSATRLWSQGKRKCNWRPISFIDLFYNV